MTHTAGRPPGISTFVERTLALNSKPAAYVCINRSCREPLTTATGLAAMLASAATRPAEG